MLLSRFKLILLCCFVGSAVSDENPCTMFKDSGPCRRSQIQYFYNKETSRCESFIYGGCRGNRNRFESLRECQNFCAPTVTSVKGEHCDQPPTSNGNLCMGMFNRFTFNFATQACERFVYGGCSGTANLYTSIYECLGSCVHGTVGLRTDIRKVFRGRPMSRTIGFRSGGGGRGASSSLGNADADAIIFPDWEQNDDSDVCNQPAVFPGPFACTAFIPRWTYDQAQGKCVEFTYGGCRGSKFYFISFLFVLERGYVMKLGGKKFFLSTQLKCFIHFRNLILFLNLLFFYFFIKLFSPLSQFYFSI